MKLRELISFGQFYSDVGMDTQLKLQALIDGSDKPIDIITLALLSEWLNQVVATFQDKELTIDIANLDEDIHTRLSHLYKEYHGINI